VVGITMTQVGTGLPAWGCLKLICGGIHYGNTI